MANMIDYLYEYGKYTFSQEPLNEVDSLILSQLVYLNYEQYVPGIEDGSAPVSIQTIYHDPGWEKILDNYWYRESNLELFTAAAESARFGTLKMNYYINIIDEADEVQFSAMTYVLVDKNVYIAYRGTDASIVGWKEDCNLALSRPLHSQRLSREYMNRVAGNIAGKFYAGGHSKGGNLAVYAAMNCSDRTRDKLIRVYNNDGPGFRPEILQSGCYEKIADRVVKFIPQSSVVGMILESQNHYEIVESKSIGMLQHNVYSWKVEDKAFVRAGRRKETTHFWDAAMNEWILSLTEEEIHSFIDTLYDVVSASEAKDLLEMRGDWKKSLQGMVEALQGIDENTRKALQKMVRSLFELAREMALSEMKEKRLEVKQELKQELRSIKIFRNEKKVVDTEKEKR